MTSWESILVCDNVYNFSIEMMLTYFRDHGFFFFFFFFFFGRREINEQVLFTYGIRNSSQP